MDGNVGVRSSLDSMAGGYSTGLPRLNARSINNTLIGSGAAAMGIKTPRG